MTSRYFPLVLVIPAAVLYLFTLAQYPILGDPTEYTFVAYVLGIAHPPGYAFMTVLGKLFQLLIPFGTVAWRMHLLAAVVGITAGAAVYGTLYQLFRPQPEQWLKWLTPLFTGFLLISATNHWQHSIHANPHIITAAFLTLNLFLLTSWGAQHPQNDRWLWLFSFSAGLGVTHHPLTVFGFPAYTLFILLTRPGILKEWRTLLKMVLCAGLGLALWLYFPLRSSMEPLVGPHTMNTWEGFWTHVLARGLSDSLPYYTLADQPIRFIVFLSIARLQYSLPVLLLAIVGVFYLGRTPAYRRFLLLYGVAFLTHYAFVMTLKAQDIMAYILGPLAVVALLAGCGVYGVGQWVKSKPAGLTLWLAAVFMAGPLLNVAFNLPRISLRHDDEGQQHIQQVQTYFAGGGQSVVLLNNWEFMTPLWYEKYVNQQWPPESDVRPLFVSAAEPWLPSVYNYLPGGPVYLNSYRREIVNDGFRLRPSGPFYQVVEPGDESIPAGLTLTHQPQEIVAFGWPTMAQAGDFVPFTLALQLPLTTTDYYAPVLQVGEMTYAFTTDSHLISPLWRANEVIVERFDFALPHNLPAGSYPAQVYLQNLSQNKKSEIVVQLPHLEVTAAPRQPQTAGLLANYRQRVGLAGATVWQGVTPHSAPWAEPIVTRPGATLNIFLHWQVLDKAEESYTVFVHLIDAGNRPWVDSLDYTPLGGAVPTHLWFPKWLPEQELTDPYRMVLPADLPAGQYFIEVGLYEMTSGRRLHMHDQQGNLVGDRFILGEVRVEP